MEILGNYDTKMKATLSCFTGILMNTTAHPTFTSHKTFLSKPNKEVILPSSDLAHPDTE